MSCIGRSRFCSVTDFSRFRRASKRPAATPAITAIGIATPMPAFAPVDSWPEYWDVCLLGGGVEVGSVWLVECAPVGVTDVGVGLEVEAEVDSFVRLNT